jgi:membrane protein
LIPRQVKKWYQRAKKSPGGWLDIPQNTIATFTEARAPQAAASLAYYAIFSLFPLLLLLIVGGSYFLDSTQVYHNVTRFFHEVIPVSQDWIDEILQQVLATRGRVGIISLFTLLWSASGFFSSLVYNIDLAWPDIRQRNYLEKRLIGLAMIVAFTGLLAFSMFFEWTSNLFAISDIFVTTFGDLDLFRMFSSLVSFITSFLLFLALYYWVPNTNLPFNASFWGALASSVAWKVVTEVFNWYLRSGLGNFQLVYGSLGAIISFLLMIYLVSLIILFGAHLCAAIDLWEEVRTRKRSKRRPVIPPEM